LTRESGSDLRLRDDPSFGRHTVLGAVDDPLFDGEEFGGCLAAFVDQSGEDVPVGSPHDPRLRRVDQFEEMFEFGGFQID